MTTPKEKRRYVHSFARQYLEDHNMKIYCGDEQVLEPSGKIYEVKKPNTRFYIGEQFVEQGELKRIGRYDELRDMGYVIVSVQLPVEKRWDKLQRVMYTVKKISDAGEHMGKMIPDHYVELDTFNKAIRIVGPKAGPLGVGTWTSMKPREAREGAGTEKTIAGISRNADLVIKEQMMKWTGVETKLTPVYIKDEIPFMITDANEIICIPNTQDMPSILICGMKRSGKSFLTHSLISRFFWQPTFNYKIVILSDSSGETGTWCLPNKMLEQINTLKRIHERPLPLPCVYFHPLVKGDYNKLHYGEVGFDMTIPFKEIVRNYEEYLDLGESKRYFSKIKDKILTCETDSEVEEILQDMTLMDNVPMLSANKIRNEFYTLLSSKMFDISTQGQSPWSISKEKSIVYNPIRASLHAGVIPIVVTQHIASFPKILSLYFNYIARDLFDAQKQDNIFVKEQSELLLVLDEAHNISGSGRKGSPADFLLRRCVKEGGPRRIGTILSTQKFGELPPEITDNTTYLMCFKSPGESMKIANQYKMGKMVAGEIKQLEKHQCLAWTSEYYVVYNNDGKKRRSRLGEIFIGKTLPPYSMHKQPKSEE